MVDHKKKKKKVIKVVQKLCKSCAINITLLLLLTRPLILMLLKHE
jgi:hypothetical protein